MTSSAKRFSKHKMDKLPKRKASSSVDLHSERSAVLRWRRAFVTSGDGHWDISVNLYSSMKPDMGIVLMSKKIQKKQNEKRSVGLPQRRQDTKLCTADTVCRLQQKRRQQSSQTSFMIFLADRATKWTGVCFNKRCLCREKIKSLQIVICDKNKADFNPIPTGGGGGGHCAPRYASSNISRPPWATDLKPSDNLNELISKTKKNIFQPPLPTCDYHSNAQSRCMFWKTPFGSFHAKAHQNSTFFCYFHEECPKCSLLWKFRFDNSARWRPGDNFCFALFFVLQRP